jgi:hypothetical protein
MYAGTNYGKLMSHPIAHYHLTSNPSQLGFNGLGFGQAVLAPAIAGSGPAAPFVAAALILAPFMAKLFSRMAKGCGQSCVLTSDAANEVERLLVQNLNMYQSSGHTRAEQKAALDYFDLVWSQLEEFCGKPEFQTTKAGRNCIDDRKAGACKWNGDDGQCWNWFVGYRDPIANDPNVKPDAAPVATVGGAIENAGQSLLGSFEGKDSSTLLLLLAAGVIVYLAS